MWMSQAPSVDDTPDMPWSYEDLSKVDYIPVLAPRDPARVGALVSALRSGGPGSYLIADQTDIAALQLGAGYPPGWGGRFKQLMAAAPGVRIAYADSSAVIYTLHWPADARSRPLAVSTGSGIQYGIKWAWVGLILLWLLLAVLAGRELIRVCRPAARLIYPLGLISWPLLGLMLEVIILRFIALS